MVHTPKILGKKDRDMLRDKKHRKFEVMYVGSYRGWRMTATIYSIPGYGYVLEQVVKHGKGDANVGPLLLFENFDQARQYANVKVKGFGTTCERV